MRRIPVSTLTRVIIDNDFAGDPDALVDWRTETVDTRLLLGDFAAQIELNAARSHEGGG